MDDQDAVLIPAGTFQYDPSDPELSEHQHDLIRALLSLLQDVRKNEIAGLMTLTFYYDSGVNRKMICDQQKVSVFAMLGGLSFTMHSLQAQMREHAGEACPHCQDAVEESKPDPIM